MPEKEESRVPEKESRVPEKEESVQECILNPFKTRAIWRERVFEVKVDATSSSSRTQYIVRNALAYSSWKNILPLFLETSHFPFHPFITFTLRWWSRWPCWSYKTPSIAVLSLVNAGLFTQSSVDSPLRESSVRPLIWPATGLLVPRFNLSYLCLSCAWRWLYGYGCVYASNLLRHVSTVV